MSFYGNAFSGIDTFNLSRTGVSGAAFKIIKTSANAASYLYAELWDGEQQWVAPFDFALMNIDVSSDVEATSGFAQLQIFINSVKVGGDRSASLPASNSGRFANVVASGSSSDAPLFVVRAGETLGIKLKSNNMTPSEASFTIIPKVFPLTPEYEDNFFNFQDKYEPTGTPLGVGILAQAGSASISIPSDSSDWTNKVQVTSFTDAGSASGTLTPDAGQDHITTSAAGTFRILLTGQGSGGNNSVYRFGIFVNNGATEVPLATGLLLMNGNGDSGQFTVQGYYNASANDTFEVWVERQSGSGGVDIDDLYFSIEER